MINLKEIAKLANVDVSTVSRALNDSDRVKPETREKIKQIAYEHNYIPDGLAKGLQQKKTYTVGVVLPELKNTFYAEIIEGMEEVLNMERYSILFGKSDFSYDKEIDCLKMLFMKRVDGIIICYPSQITIDYLSNLKRNIPIVIVDAVGKIPGVNSVQVDNVFGVKCMIEHLIQLGHKEIGFIADSFTTTQRLETFKETLKENNIPVNKELIRIGNERYEHGGYILMNQLLGLDKKPTAVFAVTDNMAIGAISAVCNAGLKVPDDISVVGFDDISVSKYISVPLTTVTQPKFEIGKIAAELILKKLNSDKNSFAQQIMLAPELVVRKSSSCPKR